MNIPKHPDSYGLKTRDCLSILTAVVLEQFSFPNVLPVRVRACARGCAFLPVRVSDSLTLSFDSNVLRPGKCLGFGFPGLRAMANKLLLLFHSPSPNPKASSDPGMLCWGWQDFLTDDQKEQRCLLLWLRSLLLLLFLRCMSCCSPGRDMTLFAASKDVRITHTSAAPRARPLLPRQLGNERTRVRQQMHRHKHALGLGPPSSTPTPTRRISVKPPSLHAEVHTATREPADSPELLVPYTASETDDRLNPSAPYRAVIQIS